MSNNNKLPTFRKAAMSCHSFVDQKTAVLFSLMSSLRDWRRRPPLRPRPGLMSGRGGALSFLSDPAAFGGPCHNIEPNAALNEE